MARRAVTLLGRLIALGSLTVAAGAAATTAHGSSPASPVCIPPPPPQMPPASDFVDRLDNRFFPLEPGTTFRYRGTEEGDAVQDEVIVTWMTKAILGVHATVVHDFVAVNGLPSERTADWYAQDKHGNVWYLGEAAFDFVDGHWVRADDSWEAGHDGARAGIIMEAHPKAGDDYTQEHYSGHAEDMARVSSTHASISVPYGSFHHALKAFECTPLEPGVLDVKYYARGVGEVFEATVEGGSAKLALVSIAGP
jgi:hypothetical protein